MPSTQLACRHCGSTLTFGVEIEAGTPVSCLICARSFAAVNPVSVATKAVRAKPSAPALRRSQAARSSGILLILLVIPALVLLTAGVALGVWHWTCGSKAIDTHKIVANEPPKPPPPAAPVQDKTPPVDEADTAKPTEGLKRKDPPKPIDSDVPPMKIKPKPDGNAVKVVGLTKAQIVAAADRGVAYLKRTQSADGSWPGFPLGLAGIGGLTLLECDVPPKDAHVQRAAGFIRANASQLDSTYELATSILLLDRLGDPADRAIIQGMALRLLAGQNQAGGWTYKSRLLSPGEMHEVHTYLCSHQPDPAKYKPLADLRAFGIGFPMAKLDPSKPIHIDSIEISLRTLPIVREPSAKKQVSMQMSPEGDNSNTQFALLALWAARRHGIPVDPALMSAYSRFQQWQNTDGGWGYFAGGPTTPTMSNVGLLALAMAHGAAPDAKPAIEDPSVVKGLKAVGRHIGQPLADPANPRADLGNIFLLWSIERVAILYDLKEIDGKDWFSWGAQKLVMNQQPGGDWNGVPAMPATTEDRYPGSDNNALSTCLALLFLRRANLVHDLTDNLRLHTGIRNPG